MPEIELVSEPRYPRALEAILSRQWLMTEDALRTVLSVAIAGEGPDYRAEASLLDFFSVEERPAMQVSDGTAVISVAGPIFPMGNMLTRSSGATSLRAVQSEFEEALSSREVKRIVLALDTPGGVADGIQAFAEQVYEAREVKPIIAVAQDMSASAGYWIGSAASEFVITPAAVAGSIGVVLRAFRSDEDEGVAQIVSTQSPRKRQSAGTKEGLAALQSLADGLADVFIESVARNRGVDVETVLSDFGQGGLLQGAQAVEAGMADRLGTLQQVIAGVSGDRVGNRANKEARMSKATDSPEITRETIAENHPAIAEAFRKEGHEEGFKAGHEAGVTAERERITKIQNLALEGFEKEAAEAIENGTEPSAFAEQVLIAQKDRGVSLEALREGQAAPFGGDPAPSPAAKVDRASIFNRRAQAARQ